MTELDTSGAWLSFQELSSAREQLPILYVHAVPVRVDDRGEVIKIGLLLRPDAEGNIANEIVGGRVLYHERIRDALARHIETDLGPMALPRIPMAPQPFQVAEFFPTHGVTPFHDPRQHAVSLVYVVAVMGDCSPPQDSLQLAWIAPADAVEMASKGELTGGHGTLLRQALAQLGYPI